MPFIQTFKIVALAFRMAPLRLFLTILGIVIGVAAVIMVMSIGASAQKLVVSQVEKIGSNVIAILPRRQRRRWSAGRSLWYRDHHANER